MSGIVEDWPTTTEQLESISGVGPATIEQFGYDIVELIRQREVPDALARVEDARVEDAGLQVEGLQVEGLQVEGADDSPPDAKLDPPPEPLARSVKPQAGSLPDHDSTLEWETSDAYWTWRLFHDGYSAAQIERIRHRDTSSLAEDLILAAEAGQSVDPAWMPESRAVRRVQQAIGNTVIGG